MTELENTATQQDAVTDTDTQMSTEPERKSYTQDDIDAIVEKRLARERRSQKTTDEKHNELQKNYDSALSELAALKAEKKVISANAKLEFAEFVASKVLSMGDDFEANLAEYKKNNPQYFGETVVKKVSTSPDLSGKAGASTTNDKMNNLIRGARK